MAARWLLQPRALLPTFNLQHFRTMFAATSTTPTIVVCLASLLPFIYCFAKRFWSVSTVGEDSDDDAEFTDEATNPPLLKKHSTLKSYHVPKTGFTYPSIRTFFRQHPQIDKLPTDPTPLPLLVAIHGLGGCIAQFNPILSSLVSVAPTLAIDLPGCGSSSFQPKEKKAYNAHALVHLLAVAIEEHRNVKANQGVIFVCHSMGCSLGALLVSTTSPYQDLISEHVCAVVSICPGLPLSLEQRLGLRLLLLIPEFVFEALRERDRRGGTESASVARLTGPNADKKTKKLQLVFNKQSQTPVWRRMASGGLLPDYSSNPPLEGVPGENIWKGIKTPILLVAGQDDHTTPAENVRTIASWLGHEAVFEGCKAPKSVRGKVEENDPIRDNGEDSLRARTDDVLQDNDATHDAALTKPTEKEPELAAESRKARLETTIFPSPATHALLYAEDTARVLSAHVRKFFSNVDERLDPGWQLHHLNQGGKWDVKNLEKWKAVTPVSKPIADFFRALKTLREVDTTHTPRVFAKEWSPTQGNGKDGLGSIAAVIDITHDSPVYDPEGLRSGGISYTKWPTVSKFPPTAEEVKTFNKIVDSVHSDLLSDSHMVKPGVHRHIAVHCHYGFNRTGFFLVAYMVERLGWKLKDAIAEFARAKEPGIKHSHFIDELFAQYPNS